MSSDKRVALFLIIIAILLVVAIGFVLFSPSYHFSDNNISAYEQNSMGNPAGQVSLMIIPSGGNNGTG